MNIQYCAQEAMKAPYEKGRERVFSCILNSRGRIIGEGHNSYSKTHTKMAEYSKKAGQTEQKCFLHAEIKAIIAAARFNQKDCKIIIARINRSGKLLNSKPCIVCTMAIASCDWIKFTEYFIGDNK